MNTCLISRDKPPLSCFLMLPLPTLATWCFWTEELASLCVRGQLQQVVDALEKPEFAKFASQPLDAAGPPWEMASREPGKPTAGHQELQPYTWQCLEDTLSLHRPGKSVLPNKPM